MRNGAGARHPANRLAGEASPYLLQHAHNPVDWYPWGPEALDRATRENRPILLSIGYAACHWCHVMERESFEDEATARLMNEHFVCIKVDREERPDLDSVYMDAVQAMTGSGGWPMTVFLTPDGHPFYAGTYFPNEERHGLPSFTAVLQALAALWREERDRAEQQGGRVAEALRRASATRESTEPLSPDILATAQAGLRRAFDPEWGGFGRAPKFPQPMTLEFLLRCHLRGYEGSLDMVRVTLDRMAAGGVHDQAGGGFHRYSTDGRWHVPHFEKMLYDNAQLARLYTHAWQVTGHDPYRRVATGTLEYLLREMRGPEGGFFSSQDADSEGVEGRFFVWSWDELVEHAVRATGWDPPRAALVARALGAQPEGNWEGTNVLWRPLPAESVAGEAGVAPLDLERAVQSTLALLLETRQGRVRPGTDDKVVTAWNGLAAQAFAEAGRVFGEPRYVRAATGALRFLAETLVDGEGRVHRAWRDGRLAGPGYLDDYACLALGALDVYETTFDLGAFRLLRSLVDGLLELFADAAGGGFFQTGSDAEALVVRPKELFDNAVPSGNSAGAEVLLRMALLTGETRYEQAGVSALRLVRDLFERAPSAFGHALSALDLHLSESREVAVIGDLEAEGTQLLLATVRERFLPNAVVAAAAPGDVRDAAKDVALLEGKETRDGEATAYVCQGFACRQPVTRPEDLAAQLST